MVLRLQNWKYYAQLSSYITMHFIIKVAKNFKVVDNFAGFIAKTKLMCFNFSVKLQLMREKLAHTHFSTNLGCQKVYNVSSISHFRMYPNSICNYCEGSCYILSTRNNCCKFLAYYGVIIQSVTQSFLLMPVCGASLTYFMVFSM